MKHSIRHANLLPTLFLVACSSSPALKLTVPDSPAFSQSRPEQVAALELATPCCFKVEDLSYAKIESLPFDDYFIIDGSSQVLSENGSKSFALGLELPQFPEPKRLYFLSTSTTSWIYTGGYFSPEVIVLDETFEELLRRDDFLYDADEDTNFQLDGIRGQTTLPSNAKYLVFRTNEERMAARSAYFWSGSRSYAVEDYAAAITRPAGVYSDRIVVKPHLPVGRIWISLSSPQGDG